MVGLELWLPALCREGPLTGSRSELHRLPEGPREEPRELRELPQELPQELLEWLEEEWEEKPPEEWEELE